MLNPLTVWITTNHGKILKTWEYQITSPASLETCIQVKKQQLEPDMEQQTDSKLGKGDFPGSPEVKNLPCNAGDMDSIPGEPVCSGACSSQLESPSATTKTQ